MPIFKFFEKDRQNRKTAKGKGINEIERLGKIMVIFKGFFCKTYVMDIAFFATSENKIIAYNIPTGPSMFVKERFPLSLFL